MPPFKLHLFGRSDDLAAADETRRDANSTHVLSADMSPGSETSAASSSKISRVIAAISTSDGATIAELTSVSGWQPHTIRAALSRLRRKSMRIDHGTDEAGRRVYRLASDEGKA